MTRCFWFAILLLLPFAPVGVAHAQTEYEQQVAEWRRHFDADLVAEGWLTLIGRERVPEGETSVGSSRESGIVLPPPAPKRVGQFNRSGTVVEFIPAPGAGVSIDGLLAAAPTRISTEPGRGKIRVQSLTLQVRSLAGDYYVGIEDDNSPAIGAFKGTAWFPVDAGYRVRAGFLPYDRPRETVFALTFPSATKTFVSTGDVLFQLNGQALRLQSFVDGDELFLIFQDETNGAETYGGGRYLSAPLPKDGFTTVDFNKAFYPYCAVNPYVICAVTPRQNRLPVEVRAGAKFAK